MIIKKLKLETLLRFSCVILYIGRGNYYFGDKDNICFSEDPGRTTKNLFIDNSGYIFEELYISQRLNSIEFGNSQEIIFLDTTKIDSTLQFVCTTLYGISHV